MRPFVERVNDVDVLDVYTMLCGLCDTETHLAFIDSAEEEDPYVAKLNEREYGNGFCFYYFARLVLARAMMSRSMAARRRTPGRPA